MGLPADFHTHSEHSEDSTAPMKSMIERGIEIGLESMCFTDHMDMDYPECPDLPAGSFMLDTKSYKEDFDNCKELYGSKIDLHYGVELGLQPHLVAENNRFIKDNEFEFVIGSTHLIGHTDPYYTDFWADKKDNEVFRAYFEESLTNVKLFKDFDVYGHLDYVVRYSPNKDTFYNPSDYSDVIDELLKILISEGKGLDLNSKALYSNMSEPNPCSFLLKRFKELGGEIITFGSDAHKPEDLGKAFLQMRDIALDCGFDRYCTFANRKPVFHKL